MLKALPREALIALRLSVIMFVVLGLLYPLFITGVAQGVFHYQANGSLVTEHGRVIGSTLIGQEFTSNRYFWGRVSATSPQPYNANASTASNLAPSNAALIKEVKQNVARIRKANHLGPDQKIPVDLVTASGSGLDPDISVASAMLQVNRVAQARGLQPSKVRALVDQDTTGRTLFIFGDPYVNVLQLNQDLDAGKAR
ncbi:MAG: potassium-transporting ATPase subunit KdpC [Candidatus Dormibacteraeota bacterium]|nr:potassium-transporting ATPase subunit KdpC [Candidatus Dormibacteraeota bacterium]